jgi:hypothetical protein
VINENDWTREAVYLPQVVEDYKDNPFIEALPPILSLSEAVDAMTVTPGYNEVERELDVHYRFHCVQRLFRYFQPLDTHLDIEQRISRAIRQGYVSRNPLGPQYAQRIRQCAEATEARSFEATDFRSVKSTAAGFTIIGMSGVGKTTAVERVLSLYPQCITHVQYGEQPFYLKQLTWMKLDCPYDGSIKGLCLSFFAEADRILDASYSKRFHSATTVDAMIPKMAHIASAHGIGLLVIDEIQHLSMAKSGGSEKMLNFFVTLVNTIGIPVLLIGTTKAMSILQSEFRQARRGSGQGDLLWDRMQNDTSWRIMLQSMWEYQWTTKHCPLAAELEQALYDESQGIIDIAVKLYALAQIKAIADGTETVTPASIREVAAERLRLVKPMLDALRAGDKKKLLQYEDIRPISVEDYIAAQASKLGAYTRKVSALEEQAVLRLLEMEVPSKTARTCVRKVLSKSTEGQPLGNVIRKAFKMAMGMETQTPDAGQDDGSAGEDIRSAGGYAGLQESGVIDTDTEW